MTLSLIASAATLWLQLITPPAEYTFPHEVVQEALYTTDAYTIEVLQQRNGPDTWQRVIRLIPLDGADGNDNADSGRKRPAVVVPFYYPEAMLGYDPAGTPANGLPGTPLPRYKGIEMMDHLARRGYITISAESYHLTYPAATAEDKSTIKATGNLGTTIVKDREDFSRWADAAAALQQDYPQWTGVGKLVHDTRLLIDLLEEDERVDADRIGIAGHSLGGKMAFYTACFDARIKVVLASDFGLCWDSTNWDAPWYWGPTHLQELKAAGQTNATLLKSTSRRAVASKANYSGKTARAVGTQKAPLYFCLIAGESDTDASLEAITRARVYPCTHKRAFNFINHATGHRPPSWALEDAYSFLDSVLK